MKVNTALEQRYLVLVRNAARKLDEQKVMHMLVKLGHEDLALELRGRIHVAQNGDVAKEV